METTNETYGYEGRSRVAFLVFILLIGALSVGPLIIRGGITLIKKVISAL